MSREPAARPRRLPHPHPYRAIIVGAGHPGGKKLPPRKYAVADAEAFLKLAPDLGHGIFTSYVLEGLERAIGGNRHPMMKGEMEGALPLVKVPRT